MKFLEYSGNYTKFKTGVTQHLIENTFEAGDALKYTELYLEWKMLGIDPKDKVKLKQKDELKVKLIEIENEYSYETIAAIRQVAIDKHKFDLQKARDKEEKDRKIADFEYSKRDGVMSYIGWGKSDEEAKKDEEEVK